MARYKYLYLFIYFFFRFLEPVVEIKASVNISIASWHKGTPIPMICIMKQNVYEQAQLLVSKMNPISIPYCLEKSSNLYVLK